MTRFFLSDKFLISYSLHESMTQLIFVYYLHQQCLLPLSLALSCFYSRLMSVYQLHFRRRKKKTYPMFFFLICIHLNFSCLGYLLLTLLYTHNRVIYGIFHMSLCACAFVYVNNLCVYVCNLTNNAKNILSINSIIIYSFPIISEASYYFD